jgi:hypothetical protein
MEPITSWNIPQGEAALLEDSDPPPHEGIVVGDLAGREPQFLYSRLFGKGNPDFRNKHPFKIETSYLHELPLLTDLLVARGGLTSGTPRGWRAAAGRWHSRIARVVSAPALLLNRPRAHYSYQESGIASSLRLFSGAAAEMVTQMPAITNAAAP